jgi:hypothetical protein
MQFIIGVAILALFDLASAIYYGVEQEWASLIIPVLALLFYVSWRMFPRLIG